ncbi:MAG: hypothetical protein HYR56_11005 [Acidobacteria bacterium]|nr:hypothetical protein [Acidobacteriota bacterium]MBI3428311.1 hypothetical protein [Acidobacteriota bacterium]
MSQQDPIKLIPRNVAALRRGQKPADAARLVTGNSAATRLESGVGNCFPGLECDLRNLEHRFFPFLEVEIVGNTVVIVAVELAGVQSAVAAGQLTAAQGALYQLIANDANSASQTAWRIEQLSGTFVGQLGNPPFVLADLNTPSMGAGRRPPDAWAAIRLLAEDTPVTLTVRRDGAATTQTLTGNRARYLDDNGALAQMFAPGELTQSLCSPWTHDFRDCGCYYWAANHPDIAKPPSLTPPSNVLDANADVPWERVNRNLTPAPTHATAAAPAELRHYEINTLWQTLNFVLEGRELLGPYQPGAVSPAPPFATQAELETQLRYAAGVELAVMHEYLTAVFSLKVTGLPAALRDDVTAARAELLRIAIGEMRHLRAVNDVLAALPAAAPFTPALRVATSVPGVQPGAFLPVQMRPALPAVIDEFIAIEQPSRSVDGVYARILATLGQLGSDEQEQTIRTIMAEGEDHFETFQFIREWLGRHTPNDYLRAPNLAPPPAANLPHQTLQQRYRTLLQLLFDGYRLGLPAGAPQINAARTAMLGPTGLQGAAEAVAQAGFLVVFDALADPRFAPLNHP